MDWPVMKSDDFDARKMVNPAMSSGKPYPRGSGVLALMAPPITGWSIAGPARSEWIHPGMTQLTWILSFAYDTAKLFVSPTMACFADA